jgi:hypothetical protein
MAGSSGAIKKKQHRRHANRRRSRRCEAALRMSVFPATITALAGRRAWQPSEVVKRAECVDSQ